MAGVVHPRTLADFTGPSRESGDQTVYQCCPVCGSTSWKLYVNMLTGQWYCFAGGHGSGGTVLPGALTSETRMQLLEQLQYDGLQDEAWPEVVLPPWIPLGAVAAQYCKRRGIRIKPENQAVEMRDERRIIFPYFGSNRRVISWSARCYIDADVSTHNPKYKQMPGAKPLYMLPDWGTVDRAIIVEGVVDALAVWHFLQVPVIAIGGARLSQRTERDIRQLVRKHIGVLLDHDKAGVVGAFAVRDQLMDRYNVSLLTPYLPAESDPADDTGWYTTKGVKQWLATT